MKFEELPKRKNGRELKVKNGAITSVSIDNDSHGMLTAWLQLEFEGSGCGFGGYGLGKGDGGNLSEPSLNYAAEWFARCISTVHDDGYGTWENLKGKPVRALTEGLGGGIVAIGHFFKDKWFCPSVEFEAAKR